MVFRIVNVCHMMRATLNNIHYTIHKLIYINNVKY